MECTMKDSNRKKEMLILPIYFTQFRKKNRCQSPFVARKKCQKAQCITALLNLNPALPAGWGKIFGIGQQENWEREFSICRSEKPPYQGSLCMKNFNTKTMPRNWKNLTRALLDEELWAKTISRTLNNNCSINDF